MMMKDGKYMSKKQHMKHMKHEKTEGKKDRMSEYGPKGKGYGKAGYGKRNAC
jgi:hypothetical protein